MNHRLFGALLLVITGLLPSSLRATGLSQVVIVSSYHEELENKRNMLGALKVGLDGVFTNKTFYLDSKRLSGEKTKEKANFIRTEINRIKPQLVFLSDDNALRLLGDYVVKHGYPLIYFGINDNPRKYLSHKSLSQSSGVLERPMYKRGIYEFRDFIPNAKMVTILLDNSPTSTAIIEELFGNKQKIPMGEISLNYKIVRDLKELSNTVNTINHQESHYLAAGTLHTLLDGDRNISMEEVIFWLSQHHKRPLITFWSHYIDSELAMGGYVIKISEQGRIAAQLARELILQGDKRRKVSKPENGIFVISKSQIKRWGIEIPKKYSDLIEFTD